MGTVNDMSVILELLLEMVKHLKEMIQLIIDTFQTSLP